MVNKIIVHKLILINNITYIKLIQYLIFIYRLEEHQVIHPIWYHYISVKILGIMAFSKISCNLFNYIRIKSCKNMRKKDLLVVIYKVFLVNIIKENLLLYYIPIQYKN